MEDTDEEEEANEEELLEERDGPGPGEEEGVAVVGGVRVSGMKIGISPKTWGTYFLFFNSIHSNEFTNACSINIKFFFFSLFILPTDLPPLPPPPIEPFIFALTKSL